MSFRKFLTWEGTVDRGTYALVGLIGFAIKHNLDRLIAALVFHRNWRLFNYWIPLDRAVRITSLNTADRRFLFWMLVSSMPFIWVGVALTIQRLRSIGWPASAVVLFFAPYLNLLFFLVLCVWPARSADEISERPRMGDNRTLGKIIPRSKWGSAAMALLVSSVIGIAGTLLSVNIVLATYGIGLFVALPFCLGLIAVVIYGYHEPHGYWSCIAVACASVAGLALLLLALAMEGIICLLMAAPIGTALAILGGSVGYFIQRRRWSDLQIQTTFSAMLLFVPVLMGAEGVSHPQAPLLEVRTQIEISAPPATVWRFLTSFPTLPAPTEWPFRVGIAYPIRSTLQGTGLTARRECQFSSGNFVEPIRVWDENKRLVFSISGEPAVMEEMSPYGHIHTRHIDGQYFQAQDAEFVLTELPNGHTLLTGTSRYRNRMWPVAYWRLWSDAIVHQIHLRVFRHVKQLSEAAESGSAAQLY
jgi:hypothetical protein